MSATVIPMPAPRPPVDVATLMRAAHATPGRNERVEAFNAALVGALAALLVEHVPDVAAGIWQEGLEAAADVAALMPGRRTGGQPQESTRCPAR